MPDAVAYEQQFRRAGLPLLIEGRTASRDVYNRAFPLLALVFVAELLGAASLRWSFALNAAAVVAAVAAALLVVAGINRVRGRRALAIPEDVGPVELAIFALLPAIVPLVFDAREGKALATLGINVGLLALVGLVFGFGLGSILRWASGRLLHQLAASMTLLARAVPLLLLFAIVLFVNTEMWQVFAHMRTASLVATGLLLGLVAASFLAVRIPREVQTLEASVGGTAPPLDRAQRANVGLVLLISYGLQALVVTLAIGAFFVALGMLIIDAEVLRAWTERGGKVLVRLDVLGVPLRLTDELLRVASAIAALSGLYYAISVLTDSGYRDEFLEDITGEMRATFTARTAYLEDRAAAGGDGADGDGTGGAGSPSSGGGADFPARDRE